MQVQSTGFRLGRLDWLNRLAEKFGGASVLASRLRVFPIPCRPPPESQPPPLPGGTLVAQLRCRASVPAIGNCAGRLWPDRGVLLGWREYFLAFLRGPVLAGESGEAARGYARPTELPPIGGILLASIRHVLRGSLSIQCRRVHLWRSCSLDFTSRSKRHTCNHDGAIFY